MSLNVAAIGLVWIGITLYAVFAGADFGAGFWDLLAGGARRGARPRAVIESSIGPVWEANHVWLIFCLVILWTGFPPAYAAIASTLWVPLTAAAIGIILRGSGFAFRKAATTVTLERNFGATFALSSLITPFFLGAVAGAIASGRVPVGNAQGNIFASWLNPTSIACGILAVAVSAYLAAAYLAAESSHLGHKQMTAYFRIRAIFTGFAIGFVAIGSILVIRRDAPALYRGLTGRALPLTAAASLFGALSIGLAYLRRYALCRASSAMAVTAVIWGWGIAQYPYLLPESLTVANAASEQVVLRAILIIFLIGLVILVPSLWALFALYERDKLTPSLDSRERELSGAGEIGDDGESSSGG